MRIAICDDEIDFRKKLLQALHASSVLPHDAEISEFPDGTALILNPVDLTEVK